MFAALDVKQVYEQDSHLGCYKPVLHLLKAQSCARTALAHGSALCSLISVSQCAPVPPSCPLPNQTPSGSYL